MLCQIKNAAKIAVSILLSICLIFIFSTVAIAEEYSISEIEAKLSIPDDWYTFSKYSTKDAYPYLYEEAFDTCMTILKNNPQVCLYAISPESESEIIITYVKNTDKINFNSISDSEFYKNLDYFKQGFIDNGFDVTQCSIFHGTNTKYLKLLYSYPNDDIYAVQYCTSTTNNSINITFNSYGDVINSDDEDIAKSVANSLTGLSDGLFEAKNISASSSFNLEEPLSKALGAAIAGGIFALIGKAFHSSSSEKEEKQENIQTVVTSENANASKNSNEKIKNNFCRVCGEKLPDNSNFCSKCGTEVLNQYENRD